MTIELGNRLAALRKEKGYSQEDLAEKLGVSRQAVSKWENGEASPDTNNLIALADLYGISLDELVGKKGPASSKEEVVEGEVVDEGPSFDKDLEDCDCDDEECSLSKKPLPRGTVATTVISSVGFLIALVAYLIVGFTWPGPKGGLGWASGWILLFIPVIIISLIRAIVDRRASHFAISVLVVAAYCGMGIIGSAYDINLWHPYWVLFFLIPIYHIIAGLIDGGKLRRR